MKLFSLTACLLLTSTVAFAQRPGPRGERVDLPQDLKDALERAKTSRFSGTRTVTFVRAGRIETHNEFVTKDGGNLRIEFDKSSPYAGQIIVETQDSRKHYFPDKNEIRVAPSFGKKQFEGIRGLFRSPRGGKVRIESSPGGLVAGLQTTRYQVLDKNNNPIVQVFIEPRTGFIAKRVVFDPTGNIGGSYEFVKVTLNPRIVPGAFNIYRKGATVIRPIDELRKQVGSLNFPLLTLPNSSGYQLESVYVKEIRGAKVLVQNFGREDSRLTMFLTKSPLDSAELKKYERGELSSYVWSLNGVTLVMIGDQPEDRLRSLASQVSD